MDERPNAFADEVVHLLKGADDGLARKLGDINRARQGCAWDTALRLCKDYYTASCVRVTGTTDCCQGLILAHRGAVLHAMGTMKKAKRSYQGSRNLFSCGACNEFSNWNEGVVCYGIGLVAQSCCDWGVARRSFEESLDIFETVKKEVTAKEKRATIATVRRRLVMLEQLREAEEEKAIKNSSSRSEEETQDYEAPLIGRTSAGEPIYALDLDLDGELPGKLVLYYDSHRITRLGKGGKLIDKGIAKKPGMFALQIKGSSMVNAKIKDGDYVIFQYQETADQGDIVVVRIDDIDGSYSTVKRFYFQDNTIILKADSSDPAYVRWEKRVTKSEPTLTILGRAVAVARPIASSSAV